MRIELIYRETSEDDMILVMINYSLDNIPLHFPSGFSMLSEDQWNNMVLSCIKYLCFNDVKNLLEIGCGSGGFLKTISDKYPGVNYYGVDYSESLIEIAKNNIDGVFNVFDATNDMWNFHISFDIIISFSVFQYFDNYKSAEIVLDNMLTHLSKHGQIYIGDIPNIERKDISINLREGNHQEKNRLLPSEKTDHLYYSKDFFFSFAKENNLKIEIFEHNQLDSFTFFPNSSCRFSIIFKS